MTQTEFGRVDEEDLAARIAETQIQDEPVVLPPIIAYDRKPDENGHREEHVIELTASPIRPMGSLVDVTRTATARGELQAVSQLQFLFASLLPESRETLRQALDSEDLWVAPEALQELIAWLLEFYAQRPTAPRSERRTGPRHTGRTTQAARASAASTSRPAR